MNNGLSYENKSRLSTNNNNANNGIPMIVTADPLATSLHNKKTSSSGKFNQTVAGSN